MNTYGVSLNFDKFNRVVIIFPKEMMTRGIKGFQVQIGKVVVTFHITEWN